MIILGDKFSAPYSTRVVSSIVVRFDNCNESCLFDCGEGTQHYLLRSCIKSRQIKRIIISELTSDSCLGIIGLLATLSLNERTFPLNIYGPKGFCKYLRLFSRYSQTNFSYALNIICVRNGIICQFSDYKIIAMTLNNSYPSIYGYSILEKERMGKFRVDYAQKLLIPFGPLYGDLKKLNKLILNNGSVLNGKNFCQPPMRGRKLTYISHCTDISKAIKIAWKSDILILNTSIECFDTSFSTIFFSKDFERIQTLSQEARIKYLFIIFCIYCDKSNWRANFLWIYDKHLPEIMRKQMINLTYKIIFKINLYYVLNTIQL
uniref:Uncharacterized protein n=1 Tax=Bangiopsis subsimplex TaxID=139980 RepID=A0A1C9CCH6_9RHOD|nr:hypothetical protein Bangp_011 [Bangiopsis subsimplex]AOM66093.1 hypothetical protein Bangp_011 [Bangiopsis subsimplex]